MKRTSMVILAILLIIVCIGVVLGIAGIFGGGTDESEKNIGLSDNRLNPDSGSQSVVIGSTSSDGWTNYGEITDSIIDAGAEICELPKVKTVGEALMAIDKNGISGIIIPGGGDINPAKYGEEITHTKEEEIRKAKDTSEIAYFRAAIILDMPVLGICRGAELINVASDGALLQDVSQTGASTGRHDGGVYHRIFILSTDSIIYKIMGESSMKVYSFHHQAPDPDRLGDNIIVTAMSEDGVAEVIERTDRTFVMGVMTHPEKKSMRSEGWSKLFEEFCEQSHIYMNNQIELSVTEKIIYNKNFL